MQAAALARVRERRKQHAEQREAQELATELEYLAQHPETHTEVRARAKEQRSVAADRLRMRRHQRDAGEEDGFPHARRLDSDQAGCARNGARARGARSRQTDIYEPEHFGDAEPTEEDWLEPFAGDHLPDPGWLAGSSEAFTSVGFVIRGDPSDLACDGRRDHRLRTPGAAEAAHHANSGARGVRGLRGRDNAVAPRRQGVPVPHQSSPHHSPRGPTSVAEFTALRDEEAHGRMLPQAPEVLQIRSPERADAKSHRPRFDAPPFEPPDPDLMASPGESNPRAEQPAAASSPARSGGKGRARRKPWQRAPVPLDRPLE